MKVVPLASESLGVRSMATYVEADDVSIVIDPAVALAPERYGLPPHPMEEEAKARLWRRIKEHVARANIVIISHYHYDHVDPDELDIFTDKVVFVKHPTRMINQSQMGRASTILAKLKELAKEINVADGRSFEYGGTEIRFSQPVPHGLTPTRGYVLEVSIRGDDAFLYTSDVQGPVLKEQVDFILREKPRLLFVDGPTTYIESDFMPIELGEACKNLVKIIREADIRSIVIDHHLTRDINYLERIKPVYDVGAELGVDVQTAAEFLNEEPNLLEAKRRELYEKSGGD